MQENTSVLDVDFAPKGADYLEQPAKLPKVLKDIELEKIALKKNLVKMLHSYGYAKEAYRVDNCGQKWRPLECPTPGHGQMFKRMTCSLPYCPECGKKGSWYNQRRAKRVRETLLGFPALGNYVFTLPKELSAKLPGSKEISQLFKLAWEILQVKFQAEAAVIVLHYCGDKSDDLHLHFDCSFPILHPDGNCSFPLPLLERARASWTEGVGRIFKTFLIDTVGHYGFDVSLEQQLHWCKYATRSTMPAEKFIGLSQEQQIYCLKMHSKRNIRYFGGFLSRNKKKFLADNQNNFVFEMIKSKTADDVERCVCPICGQKMKHSRYNDNNWVWMDDIPISNFVRYDKNTFISRVMFDYIREQEVKKAKPLTFFEVIEQSIDNEVIDEAMDCLVEQG
ncbi:MAG: hypothetical protein WC412_08200 [Candidatus Omnitrophota bacterium]|jgi:hypothetical protein